MEGIYAGWVVEFKCQSSAVRMPQRERCWAMRVRPAEVRAAAWSGRCVVRRPVRIRNAR
jgi:hypothetical protein